MNGTPVWLCSISRPNRRTGGRLAVPLWSPSVIDESAGLLRRVLGTAGNAARERLFRMNVTLCLHRAATDDEVAALPGWARDAEPIDLAGGPVAVLAETEPGAPSTKPCENPTRDYLPGGDPLLWVPSDCGSCEPCRARAAIMTRRGRAERGEAPSFVTRRGR